MTAPTGADVLVIGGGPAGAATAAALAGRGLDVLLVGDEPNPGASHDAALSSSAVQALIELDASIRDDLRPVDVVRLEFGRDGHRAFTGTGTAVCDRDRLGHRLRRAAVAAGAEHLLGRVIAVRHTETGAEAVIDTVGCAATTVVARHVVVAVGAAPGSRLLPRQAPHTTGESCARRFAVSGQSGMVLHPVPPSNIDPRGRPRCIWVLPGDPGTCTIGVVAVGGPVSATPEDLLGEALAALTACDERFATARPLGPVASGPINSGFAPERAVHARCLLVGDAAGLANPFTGEGLGYAVQSAVLAARSIAAHPADPAAAQTAYRSRLATAFVGYFETARHAARRYHLAWRVLSATARSDHPFYAMGRRTMLLPDGITNPISEAALAGRDELFLRPFLAACDEIAIATVRKEWPFIARLLITDASRTPRLRPATLFLAALTSAGAAPAAEHAAVGAAMDLAALGALAFLGPVRPVSSSSRGVDWETAVTVLACDFLMAQAARLVAESAPEAAWAFSDWLAELTARRAARLHDPAAVSAGDLFASLFEFPARVGAELGGAPAGVVQQVRDFGHHIGRAFLLAEDILALRGLRTRLDTTTAGLLTAQVSMFPELLGRPDLTADQLAGDPRIRAAALTAAEAACHDNLRTAHKAAADIPGPISSRILQALAEAIEPSPAPAGQAPSPPRPGSTRRSAHETHHPV